MMRVHYSCTREELEILWSYMEDMAPTHQARVTEDDTQQTRDQEEAAPLLQCDHTYFEVHCQ